MAAILRLIAAGVPAAKIIAKYGKKAYKAAKKQFKLTKDWHKDLTKGEKRFLHYGVPSPLIGVPISVVSENRRQKKKKEKKLEKKLEKKTGGQIKTYARGSIVRKPKY